MIKNFFKRSLKQNYLTALIKVIAPKIVITHISDSEDFHVVSKILNNKIQFIAIQAYTPNAFNRMFSEKGKKIFLYLSFFVMVNLMNYFTKRKKLI